MKQFTDEEIEAAVWQYIQEADYLLEKGRYSDGSRPEDQHDVQRAMAYAQLAQAFCLVKIWTAGETTR